MSLAEASAALGFVQSNDTNPILIAESKGCLFSVVDSDGVQKVPAFQIDKAKKVVYPIIKDLLYELNDRGGKKIDSWLIFDWFTSPIDDKHPFTPAELLCDKNSHEELLYLASQTGASNAGRYAI